MVELIIAAIQTLNQILTAGIAITAFSLMIYALSFNLQDRVARSFAIILICVAVVFTGDSFSTIASSPFEIAFWLRFQWVGIVVLPAAYFHFSDALLETTGRPSRGRRRKAARAAYGISVLFLIALPLSLLVGPLVVDGEPAPYLERTQLTWFFVGFYLLGIIWSWINFWRAYGRAVLPTSRRRMQYLLAGALAPALGSFPYLLFGPGFAARHPLIFWSAASLSNIFVTVLLVVMAYAVAFFGVPWPDRVVKRRLFKWLMRGPVTASTVLAISTLIRRLSVSVGFDHAAISPIVMVATVLTMEHLITLAAPYWERYLFHGGDHEDMRLIQTLEERMLTTKDLRQFLDAILAAVCDKLQVSTAFVAAITGSDLEFVVTVGDQENMPVESMSGTLARAVASNGAGGPVFAWGNFWLMPLSSSNGGGLLGLLGVVREPDQDLFDDQKDSLIALGERAALALEDRRLQQQVFLSLKDLSPQVELIQRLRAASSYDQQSVLQDLESLGSPIALSQSVKEALSHYWGGPKLTESPLLDLEIVKRSLSDHDNNPVNALRSILKIAIERVRPEGDRRFTAEWILYNILEMKFMQGRKVRDVAMRLAMSEADLYRKQRVAIEAVAQAIAEMEVEAQGEKVE
jgi:hypothetical protein